MSLRASESGDRYENLYNMLENELMDKLVWPLSGAQDGKEEKRGVGSRGMDMYVCTMDVGYPPRCFV